MANLKEILETNLSLDDSNRSLNQIFNAFKLDFIFWFNFWMRIRFCVSIREREKRGTSELSISTFGSKRIFATLILF